MSKASSFWSLEATNLTKPTLAAILLPEAVESNSSQAARVYGQPTHVFHEKQRTHYTQTRIKASQRDI